MTTQKEQAECRAKFEKHCRDNLGYGSFDLRKINNDDGQYAHTRVIEQWALWQACWSARPSQAAAGDSGQELRKMACGFCGHETESTGIGAIYCGPHPLSNGAMYPAVQMYEVSASDDSRRGDAPNITAEEMAAFSRFCDTCEDCDAGGYDVPKSKMQRLARIGLVRWCGSSRYETTEFGDAIRNDKAKREGGGDDN